MAKQSGYLMRQEARTQRTSDAAQRLMCQYMMDTLQMTLHQTEGWGYDRIMRLCEAWTETRKKYSPSMNPSDPEADVYQEHMDRVLAEILRDRQPLISHRERYPELKKVRYGKE